MPDPTNAIAATSARYRRGELIGRCVLGGPIINR
jgi:hypothetical protein